MGTEAGEVERLRAANARLRAVTERQAAELAALGRGLAASRREVEVLSGRVERLSGLVAELQARLAQNAKNSSRPPSSEGLGKKPAQPRKRGGRRGKQPGAPGAHLAQVAEPDAVVDHAPAACGGCGGGLDDAPVVGSERRQVFDLPRVRAHVTEHRAQPAPLRLRTGHRRAVPAGGDRAGVLRPERARGDRLPAGRPPPAGRARRAAAGRPAGHPGGHGHRRRGGRPGRRAHRPAVAAIRRLLAAAAVAHFDETGARVDGRLHWVHTACTALLTLLTLLTVHARRGKTAMDAAGVLPALAGVAVHDCWPPYFSYAVDHALCGAHLLRELTAAAETGPDQDWANHLIEVLLAAKGWADAARAAGAERIDPDLLAALAASYDGHLSQGRAANPPGRRRTKTHALIDRLDQRREQVLRFTVDLAVPFDNNQGERGLRMVKLQQKTSGGWRTLAGAEAFCAVRSHIATARKHRVHVLGALHDAMTGNPWLPTTPTPPHTA